MNKIIHIIIIAIFSVCGMGFTADKRDCTQDESMQIIKTCNSMSNWQIVYKYYKKYIENAKCDDGAMAECFSDRIVHLLATDWKNVNKLINITESDSGFNEFILRHIDPSADTDELKMIIKNTQSKCIKKDNPFCTNVKNMAQRALEEINKIGN